MITLYDLLKEGVVDYYDTENDSTEVYSAKSVLKKKVKDLVIQYNHSYPMRNRMSDNIRSAMNILSGTSTSDDLKSNPNSSINIIPLYYGVYAEGEDYIEFKITDSADDIYLLAYNDIIRRLKDDLLKDTTVRDLPALSYISTDKAQEGILEVKFKK